MAPTTPAPPPPTGEPHEPRRWPALVAVAVLVVVIAAGAWALLNGNGDSTAASTTTSAQTTTPDTDAPDTTTPHTRSPTAPLGRRAVVEHLESALGTAAQGRNDLNAFAKRLASCDLTPDDANVITSVIANRQAVQAQAEDTEARADGGSALARDLAGVMSRSAAADRTYLPWLRSRSYAASHCKVPDNVKHANSSVGAEKAAWAARFNAEAKRFGLRADWKATDF